MYYLGMDGIFAHRTCVMWFRCPPIPPSLSRFQVLVQTASQKAIVIPRMQRRARALLIFGVLIAMHMTCGIVHAREIILQCVLSLKSCLDTFVYYGEVWLQHIAAFWLQYFTFLYAIVASVLTLYLIKVFPKSNFNPMSDLSEACDCMACRHGWHKCDLGKHHGNGIGYLITLPFYCRLV